MKSLYLLITCLCCMGSLYAQQHHFVYIQTENKQPFYVRMGDKVLSSSTSGYMVIPKLKDGDHDLFIGFPKNEWPQQRINIRVKNNDAGYVLKNFDAKGWGLFNLQTMEVIMPVDGLAKETPSKPAQTVGFADVLADVVNNPSIKEKPTVKEAVKTSEPGKPIKTEEVKVITESKQEPVQEKIVEKPLAPEKKLPVIVNRAVKVFSLLEAEGRSMVYVDKDGEKTDTVRIFIPYKTENTDSGKDGKAPEKEKETIVLNNKEVEKRGGEPVIKSNVVDVVKKDSLETSTPKEKTEKPANTGDNKSTGLQEAPKEQKPVAMINSDCKSIASEDDFFRLRKKMAAQKSEENMVVIAKKAFVLKCYTTEQVRNLSALFLKDEGCYNFFDAAYPHVNDTHNYPTLINRLTDQYYINRFKAMIRQ